MRQQGAAFGSQVRHSRRLQCHPERGGQADIEGVLLWQGEGGGGCCKLRSSHSNRLQDCVDITIQVTFEDISATAAKVNRRM